MSLPFSWAKIPHQGSQQGTSKATTLNGTEADDDIAHTADRSTVLCPVYRAGLHLLHRPLHHQMVQENGNLDDADVGSYSGLIESLFSPTQTVVIVL